MDDTHTFYTPTVYVIDDDDAVRDSIGMLLNSVSLNTELFAAPDAFIQAFQPAELVNLQGCILLDIRMPGMSGLECQKWLLTHQCHLPIVFITGHGDVPMAVQAMKDGAVEFLQKPFHEQTLIDSIHNALQIDQQRCIHYEQQARVNERVAQLTPREQEVLKRVVAGNSNKVIAGELNLSQRTIEIHRAAVMGKMDVSSVAELVTLMTMLEVT
ncbi:response regulator transcription factor [Paraglaciecola polaris]|uniref:response regulator transcription factor n=1 Tax=Paraglaciecola polaris TaxID=222814 RepID=UPI0030ED6122|tara:strand:+ start:15 stop:653 length:639 start_codon:yes stop_codon:yes gene_type:complete